MTPYETLSLIFSLLGSFTVVISLYLLYRQTRIFAAQTEYVARSMRDNVSQSLNSQSHEIGRLFIEYPELRPYFYDKQPLTADHPHFQRAEAVAEVILDIFWAMQAQAKLAGFTKTDKDASNTWYTYLNDSFENSPFLCEVLTKRQGWYGTEIRDEAHKYAENLAKK